MRAITTRLGILAIVLLIVVIAGTIGFSVTEKLSVEDAFYFTIVTVATVGYGDIAPVTQAGRILSVVLIVVGVGAFTGVIVDASGYFAERRQNKVRRERTNVLVGLFMSEIGTPLLELLHCADPNLHEIHQEIRMGQELSEEDFIALRAKLAKHKFTLDPSLVRLKPVRDLLERKTDLILRLLENPMLVEREAFTESLRATCHLREELLARVNFDDLPPSDIAHLAVDASRAYARIAPGWVEHLRYLKGAYPYLFSLALRNNPFNENRCAIVR
jgi:voltage-gated potassium channel